MTAPWSRPVDPAGYPTVPTQEAVMRARIAGDPYTTGALLWSLNGPGADHLTQALTERDES